VGLLLRGDLLPRIELFLRDLYKSFLLRGGLLPRIELFLRDLYRNLLLRGGLLPRIELFLRKTGFNINKILGFLFLLEMLENTVDSNR